MKKWVFLFIAAVAIGCAASKEVAITEADLRLAKTEFSNVTLAELQTGQVLFVEHCQSCHALKNPASESIRGWKHNVSEMVEIANRKKSANIDKNEEQAILRYLITMGPLKKS